MLDKLKETQEISSDPLGDVRDLVEDVGVEQVIQILVTDEEVRNPPAGFIRLMKSGLARLTIEQAAFTRGVKRG